MRKIKKVLTLFLAGMLIITCVPMVSAYEIKQFGDFQYYIKDDIVILQKYTGTDADVVIPETIEDLPVEQLIQTFENNTTIESVVMPDTLKEIGVHAFKDCTKLSDVKFGANTNVVGFRAFEANASLKNVSLPDSLVTIGPDAFAKCGLLNHVVIPDNVTSINAGAFEDCGSLSDIKLNDKIEILSADVFKGCKSLTSFEVPSNITAIYGGAFSGCTSLTEFTVPDTVKSVGGETFMGCTSLKSVTLPDSITVIPMSLFEGCSSLTDFKMPSSVTEISLNAFMGTPIKNIDIPESVTKIGEKAFYECKNLEAIHIPSSVKKVYQEAFYGCTSLKNVTIEEGVEFLGARALSYCEAIKKIELPSTLILNQNGVFSRCSSLEEINIPSGTTTLDDRVFENCHSLKAITIPDGVETIGERAFFHCHKIKRIDMPDTVKTCGSTSFADCYDLEEVNLSQKLTAISNSQFNHCTSLKKLTLPKTVKKIGEFAFADCYSLTDIYIYNTAVAFNKNCYLGRFNDTSLTCNLMIYGYAGSTAEKYANEKNIKFTDLSIDTSQYNTVINLESETLSLKQYRQKKIGFTVDEPSGPTRFESTDESIAEVDSDGIVYGAGVGTAYIALSNGKATVVVKVIVTESEVDIKNEQENSDYRYYFVEDENEEIYVRISKYIGKKTDVAIPSSIGGYPVKVIGADSFANEGSKITGLVIPEGVEKLEKCAFYGCCALKSIRFPSTVKTVEENLFSGKYVTNLFSIEKVEFPSETALWNYIDAAKDDLKYSLPNQNPYTLVINGKTLKSISYPEGITRVYDFAFYNCSSIERINLPADIQKIGEQSFGNCASLKSVNLPAGLTEIGDSAFAGCSGLTEMILPEYLEKLGAYALSGTGIKTIEFPENTLVSSYVCCNCPSLETVYFNCKKLATYHSGIVNNCTSIKKFYVGYNAADLTEDMFQGITTVPTFIAYYNNEIFMICKRHEWEFVPIPYPWETDEPVDKELNPIPVCPDYLYDADTDTYTVTDKEGAISGEEAYPNGEAWFAKTVVFDFVGEVSLTNWCTQWFYSVENVVVRGNILSIDNDAFTFAGNSLKSAELYDNVALIDNGAFRNCVNLSEIRGGKGLKTIGNYAFAGCTGLKDIGFASSAETIGYEAFSGCGGFSDIVVPESVKKIGDYAFLNCSGADKAVIPSCVTEIGKCAFGYLYNSKQEEYYPIPNFKIIAEKGSAGEMYAVENGFDFVEIGSDWTEPVTETTTEPSNTEPTETVTQTEPATEPTDPSTEPTNPTEPITTDSWVVVKAPTCDESGVEVNYSTQESRTIPSLGHNTKIVGKKSATYFAKGYTGDNTCTVCGKVISKGKAIAKLKLDTPKVKITAGKKKLTVKYTKVKDATGFQVKYTYKGKTTTKTYTSKESVTKTIKKLKKGTYKVSVRALIKSKGKTAYSNWTKAKKAKVK